MGITGLIPFLNKASTNCNINQFSGGTAAIDAYCWLHKGAFSCADKLIMGQSSDAYVKYCMKLVHMIIAANVKPILVFDGRHLPAKANTESKRREQRDSNKQKAAELIRMGKVYEGNNLLRRSLDISHEMALKVIKQCQTENVDCIVAPYEADAQLAYLNISKIADVVITEDSDLIVFGCSKIFFKMDINGNGLLVEQDRLHLTMGIRAEHFDMDKFRHMCILSGCDYLPSLRGIGLSKACKFILKNTDNNIYNALTRLPSHFNMKSLVVTKEYRDEFIRALVTFKHQMVYCPIKRQQVRLYPPPPHVTDEQLRHAGVKVEEKLALQLALGNYHPFKLEKLNDFDPDNLPKRMHRTNLWKNPIILKHTSVFSENITKREIKLPEQKTFKTFIPKTTGQKMMTLKTNITEKTTPMKRNFEDVEEDIDYIAMYTQESKKKKEIIETNPTSEEEKQKDDKTTYPFSNTKRRNPFAKTAHDSKENNEIQKEMKIENKENINKNHQNNIKIKNENKKEEKDDAKISKKYSKNLSRHININSKELLLIDEKSSYLPVNSKNESFTEKLNDCQKNNIKTIRTDLMQWTNTKTLKMKKMANQHRIKKNRQNKRKSRNSSSSSSSSSSTAARKSTSSQSQQTRLDMFGF